MHHHIARISDLFTDLQVGEFPADRVHRAQPALAAGLKAWHDGKRKITVSSRPVEQIVHQPKKLFVLHRPSLGLAQFQPFGPLLKQFRAGSEVVETEYLLRFGKAQRLDNPWVRYLEFGGRKRETKHAGMQVVKKNVLVDPQDLLLNNGTFLGFDFIGHPRELRSEERRV